MGFWEWVTEIVRLLVVAGVGFGSAQLALWSDRRRVERVADADWVVTAISKDAAMRRKMRGWVVKNAGSKTATSVKIWLPNGEIIRDPAPLSTFKPGESELVMVDPKAAAATDASLNLNIRWTSHRGETKTTSRLLEIPY